MEGLQSTQSKSVEDEVSEKVLADMRHHHPEAARLRVDKLKDKNSHQREFDGIIVADNCIKVVEVRGVGPVHSATCLDLKDVQYITVVQVMNARR